MDNLGYRHQRAYCYYRQRQRRRQALVGALYPLILKLYLLIPLLDLPQSLFNSHWLSPLSWPRLNRSPHAFAVIRADQAIAVFVGSHLGGHFARLI